jgi:hypothetical protein
VCAIHFSLCLDVLHVFLFSVQHQTYFSFGLRSCVLILDLVLWFSFLRAQCLVRFLAPWFSCAPADLVLAGSSGPARSLDFC